MSEAIVAKRYADALFQLANDKNKVDVFLDELQTVKKVFEQNEEVVQFLNHPRVREAEKMELIDQSFQACDKDVLHTIKLLVERHRLQAIGSIVDEFVRLHHEANNVAAAVIYSVRTLSDEEKTQVEAALKKQLNKQQIILTNELDASLLGGLRIRIGNTIYDGSISGKLNRLKQTIGSVSN